MFNDIGQAINYIESKRTKRSFSSFQETINKYHIDIHQKNIIHIAGTNGKGSSTMMLKELLMHHGYHVGTFTSPYIICHNERIQIDGQMISDEDLLMYINSFYDIIESEDLSMFEIDTLIMLQYFHDHQLDYRLIECGIGGLSDKTNVVDSTMSVIVNIGYDHQFMLGHTKEDIAYQKLGILRVGHPLVTTEKDPKILKIFREECQKKNAELIIVPTKDDYSYPYHFSFQGNEYHLHGATSYQVKNTLLALTCASQLITLDPQKVQASLDDFYWPCRFERFGHIYLDGAHNEDGIIALKKAIEERHLKDVGIIFSALSDKDLETMLHLLKGYDVIQSSFDDERSRKGIDFDQALMTMKKHKNIVITGSLHFVSYARKYLSEKGMI